MNFKKLEAFFRSQTDERVTVCFDTIAEICEGISRSYIELRHLHIPAYSFAKHVMNAGYTVTGADYEACVLYAKRSDAVSDEPIVDEPITNELGDREGSAGLDERIEDTYTSLVSKLIQRRVARGQINEEELLRYIIRTGGFTAATNGYERFQPGSVIILHKEDIIELAYNKIRELRTAGINLDCWLIDACHDTRYGMRFGLWQKIFNISLKYMYIFNYKYGLFNEYRAIWSHCHCPVDQIIKQYVAERAEKAHLNADYGRLDAIVWNFISEEDYLFFQDIVAQICRAEGISSKVLFDIIYWKRPQRNA